MNRFFLIAVVALSFVSLARADEPSLKKFTPPDRSSKDEPIAKKFSMAKAADFLDNVALDWTKNRGCFSCHSNFAYLYARPTISANAPAHADIRQALEDLVSKRWPDKKPRWDAEVVAAAAALAHNDAHTTKKLHPLTRTALDRMWTVQQKDGGIRWLKLSLPPMEWDDHYGVTLAALAVGVAPENYAQTEQAKKGLDGLRRWLKANPPKNLHHQTMLLWVSTYLDGFQTADEQNATKKALLAKQLPNGGWSASSLGDWPRADKSDQTPMVADGYGTGFTLYVLRRAGVAADEGAIVKGVQWLKSNQRESGRWFTRSLVKDETHYLTHVGSAFAVMAIQACEAKSDANATAKILDLRIVVFRHHPGIIAEKEVMEARERDEKAIMEAVRKAKIDYAYNGGLGRGYQLSIQVSDLGRWKTAMDELIKSKALGYYEWGLDHHGYGLIPIH